MMMTSLSDDDKTIVRAELNFLSELLYNIYVDKEKFSSVNWRTISLRIQAVRDRVLK